MRLIRKATNETVPLEDGFLWSDEFSWKPIEQNQERAIDGTLIVQEGKKKSGRPITLSPSDSQGWIKRFNLSILKDWSALQGEQFTLVFEYPHDTRQFNVIFNHAEGAIDAEPVKGFPTVSENDFYKVTLKFIEVPNAD
ncbi:MAG: VHS1062 protein [Podoviridae sp. ctbh1]|nr:MAG: VHS1062 protein [Podoviridae sp. ctbh1]